MKDILAEIVARKRELVAEAKKNKPLAEIRQEICCGSFRMAETFSQKSWGLIAECKLQSPAKGRLNNTHTVEDLATIYAANGASVLSVHTDPHFLGKNEDFISVRKLVDVPLLRKDFLIDEYQVYEARMLGADAVLLIARILSLNELKKLLYTAWSLGMDALIEVHDEIDIKKALQTPAEFIGINNRNLVTFNTDIVNTLELLPFITDKRTIISESGISTTDDARRLKEAKCSGILVGEGLVKAEDIGAFTRELAELI